VFAGTQTLLLAETRQRGPEQFLKQGRRTVLVGVGQSRSAGRFGDAQMHQAPQTTCQAVADLAERIRTPKLAKQHGDELRPAGKSLCGAFRTVLLHQCGKLGTGKMLEQLIE
jgi:hypothetical protein